MRGTIFTTVLFLLIFRKLKKTKELNFLRQTPTFTSVYSITSPLQPLAVPCIQRRRQIYSSNRRVFIPAKQAKITVERSTLITVIPDKARCIKYVQLIVTQLIQKITRSDNFQLLRLRMILITRTTSIIHQFLNA